MSLRRLAVFLCAFFVLSVMGSNTQAQSGGSYSSEYRKCAAECRAHPEWSKCPATCRTLKSSCLKTGSFKWKRKPHVHGLAKK